ncbi:MAG: hypothetical protein WBA09_22415 [Candidatus Acidiferrum sp.]
MKCATCGKEIPKEEEEFVEINGGIMEQVAYCRVCLPKKKEEIRKELGKKGKKPKENP